MLERWLEYLRPGEWAARIRWPSSLWSQEDRVLERRRPGGLGVRIRRPSSLWSQEDRLQVVGSTSDLPARAGRVWISDMMG